VNDQLLSNIVMHSNLPIFIPLNLYRVGTDIFNFQRRYTPTRVGTYIHTNIRVIAQRPRKITRVCTKVEENL